MKSLKIFRAVALVAVMLLAAVFFGCDQYPTVIQDVMVVAEVDLSKATTRGNRTWIPLHMHNTQQKRVQVIFDVLAEFERKNPQLKVVHWHVEQSDESGRTTSALYGIWVDHEPRTSGQ